LGVGVLIRLDEKGVVIFREVAMLCTILQGNKKKVTGSFSLQTNFRITKIQNSLLPQLEKTLI
jgi:hypothetical protein